MKNQLKLHSTQTICRVWPLPGLRALKFYDAFLPSSCDSPACHSSKDVRASGQRRVALKDVRGRNRVTRVDVRLPNALSIDFLEV